jgi:hypothetical protein
MPENKPSTPASTSASASAKPKGFLYGPEMTVLQVILPVIVAGALLYYLLGLLPAWQLGRDLGLWLLAGALMILSIVIAFLLDLGLRLARRDSATKKTRSAAVGRAVKLALGGLIIPGALVAAAVLVPLPTGQTAMDLVAQAALLRPATPAIQIASVVIESGNPATKAQGIQALRASRSPEALEQLFRILDEDPSALQDPAEYESLSAAIAAYGAEARAPLLSYFGEAGPAGSQEGIAGSDIYPRYFAASFEALRAEIAGQSLDPQTRELRLAQIAAAEASLRAALQAIPGPAAGGDSHLDFVLRTFLKMEIKEDSETLAFARGIAADEAYAGALRGQALLLIAKLGGPADLATLYPFLQNESDMLQARALEAITLLQAKITASPSAK